jgi:hypothetical protein
MPMQAQLAAYAQCDLATQYDVFICGSTAVHPPAMHLIRPFAARGATVVPLIRTKLDHAKDDVEIVALMSVLEEMQRQKTYAVAGDEPLMTVTQAAATRVAEPFWRRMADDMVRRITAAADGEARKSVGDLSR